MTKWVSNPKLAAGMASTPLPEGITWPAGPCPDQVQHVYHTTVSGSAKECAVAVGD